MYVWDAVRCDTRTGASYVHHLLSRLFSSQTEGGTKQASKPVDGPSRRQPAPVEELPSRGYHWFLAHSGRACSAARSSIVGPARLREKTRIYTGRVAAAGSSGQGNLHLNAGAGVYKVVSCRGCSPLLCSHPYIPLLHLPLYIFIYFFLRHIFELLVSWTLVKIIRRRKRKRHHVGP